MPDADVVRVPKDGIDAAVCLVEAITVGRRLRGRNTVSASYVVVGNEAIVRRHLAAKVALEGGIKGAAVGSMGRYLIVAHQIGALDDVELAAIGPVRTIHPVWRDEDLLSAWLAKGNGIFTGTGVAVYILTCRPNAAAGRGHMEKVGDEEAAGEGSLTFKANAGPFLGGSVFVLMVNAQANGTRGIIDRKEAQLLGILSRLVRNLAPCGIRIREPVEAGE